MASRLEELMASEFLAKVKKKYGAAIVMQASEFGALHVPRIPTGIFTLDYALGGGYPAGRFNIVYGHKSSAKTTSLLKAVSQAQKSCANCWTQEQMDPETGEITRCACGNFREPAIVYLDVEGALDLPWAQCLGVDNSKMLISIPEYAEQALDLAEGFILNGCDLLILDSLAFLTPAKEIEESTAKDLVGQQARLIGRGVRKITAALNQLGNANEGRRPTILATNQIRMKAGLVFGNPETTSGGLAPGFAASTEVRTWAGKYTIDDATGKPIDVEMNFKVEKNKCSGAKIEGKYKLILSDTEVKKKGDVLDEDEMLRLGTTIGFVEKAGAGWRVMDEEFRAKSLIERKLMTEPSYKAKFGSKLMKLLLAA